MGDRPLSGEGEGYRLEEDKSSLGDRFGRGEPSLLGEKVLGDTAQALRENDALLLPGEAARIPGQGLWGEEYPSMGVGSEGSVWEAWPLSDKSPMDCRVSVEQEDGSSWEEDSSSSSSSSSASDSSTSENRCPSWSSDPHMCSSLPPVGQKWIWH